MLVLSRRAEEKLVFPQPGITLHVLDIRGNVVRLGVEAPPEIKVFRDELIAANAPMAAPVKSKSHDHRNRLNKISILTHLMEKLWEVGRAGEAETTLKKLVEAVDSLGREWAQSPDKAAPKPQPPKRRLLLVEDDVNQRELLAGLFSMNGCECSTAEDGQSALDYLASHERPDFVLLDMWMPRCDGPETVTRIRHDPRLADLKIFAVSGTAPRDLGLATGPEGVDAWFPKPINPGTLWASIQTHLATTASHN